MTSTINIVLARLECDTCMTSEALATACDLPRRPVVRSVARLIERGFAERREMGCYSLTRAGEAFRATGKTITCGPNGPIGPRTDPYDQRFTQRARLWSAMRILKKFTLGEILILASEARASSARRYVRALADAGYLREMPRRERGTALTSPGFKRWHLVRDTGPVAPVWRTTRGDVYDINLGRVAS